MKISVGDYDSFKRASTALGTPSASFYSVSGGFVTAALVLHATGGIYLSGDNFDSITAATFLTDFPGAILALNVQGGY